MKYRPTQSGKLPRPLASTEVDASSSRAFSIAPAARMNHRAPNAELVAGERCDANLLDASRILGGLQIGHVCVQVHCHIITAVKIAPICLTAKQRRSLLSRVMLVSSRPLANRSGRISSCSPARGDSRSYAASTPHNSWARP